VAELNDAPATEVTTEHLVAGPDRRFYAFVIDRLLGWGICGGEAYAAYTTVIEPGHLWSGVAAIVGTVLMVGLLSSMLVGLYGLTPGKALVGIRVLSADDARPIGVPRAILRTLLLGVATLPTLGFGAAALAWTAMADPSGWRRGWHDLRVGSVVVDVRPLPVAEEPEEEAPRQVVNLTAMRLVPASPTPPRRVPTRGRRPPAPPPEAAPAAAPTVTPRQGLGWPLVGDAPTDDLGIQPAVRVRPPRPSPAPRPRPRPSRSRRRPSRRSRRPSRPDHPPAGRWPSTRGSSSRCAG
jgi:uncharacterized RDD family membrane protein YckC